MKRHRKLPGQKRDTGSGMMMKKPSGMMMKMRQMMKKRMMPGGGMMMGMDGMGGMGGPGGGGMGGGPGGGGMMGGGGGMGGMDGDMMMMESSRMMKMKKDKMMMMKMEMMKKKKKKMPSPAPSGSVSSVSGSSAFGSSQSASGQSVSPGDVSSISFDSSFQGASSGVLSSQGSQFDSSFSPASFGSPGIAGSLGSTGSGFGSAGSNPDALPSPGNPSGFSSYEGEGDGPPPPPEPSGSFSFFGVPEPTPTPSPTPQSQSPFFSSFSTPAPTSISPSSSSPLTSPPSSSSSSDCFEHKVYCQNDGTCGYKPFGFISCYTANINGTVGCFINQPSDIYCAGGEGTRAYSRGLGNYAAAYPIFTIWYTYSCYDVCTPCLTPLEIYNEWLSLPPEERDAYLDAATLNNPALRIKVEAKINFHFPQPKTPKEKPPCVTTRLRVTAPSNAVAGVPFIFTVTAIGGNNQPCDTFNSTVQFTVNDAPETYNIPAGLMQNGTGTFTATLYKKGFGKRITATFTSITGESKGITVSASSPARFELFGYPNPATACEVGTVTARVLDSYGNKVPSYTGTTQFTSSDLFAVLPPQTRWKGTNTRKFQFTFKTTGSQLMTIYDVNAPSVDGSLAITVQHGPTTYFTIDFTPPVVPTAGVSYVVTVRARDKCGNIDTDYVGTVEFSSTDGSAILPGNYTFLVGDNGVKTFNITYNTTGSQIVVVQDTTHCEIIGTVTKTVV